MFDVEPGTFYARARALSAYCYMQPLGEALMLPSVDNFMMEDANTFQATLAGLKAAERELEDARQERIRESTRVVCAAMKMKDGLIVTGVRHFSPDMRATLLRIYGERYKFEVTEQGFIDTRGRFLTRAEAWKAAERHGQIRRQVSSPGELYSENLY